jgi:SAM-dependent methyltransferase
MNKSKKWHDRDTFWKNVEPVLFHRQRMTNAPGEIDKIISLGGFKPGSKILDLCCGVGRHSIELARRGFDVTGIDITTRYLKQAEARAKKDGIKIEFINADMRKFVRKSRFDVVINLFTSFGFFENQKDDKKVITNVYRSLKRGGILVMDLIGREVLAKHFRRTDWVELDGMFLLEKRELHDNWSRVHNTWILIKDGHQKKEELDLRLYTALELKMLLADCGFKRIEVYGNLAGDPYDEKAQRLVMIGHKQE